MARRLPTNSLRRIVLIIGETGRVAMTAGFSERAAWVKRVLAVDVPSTRPDGAASGDQPPGTSVSGESAFAAAVARRIAEAKAGCGAETGKMVPVLKRMIVGPDKFVAAIDTSIGALLDAMAGDILKSRGDRAPLDKVLDDWRGKVANDARLATLREAASALHLSLDVDGKVGAVLDGLGGEAARAA